VRSGGVWLPTPRVLPFLLLIGRARAMASAEPQKRRWAGRGNAPREDFQPPRRVVLEARKPVENEAPGRDGVRRIAVLGRTLSSLFFVRELKRRLSRRKEKVEISMFPAMFDPARNIYTPHAICEFTSSQFAATTGQLKKENQQLAELEARFQEDYLRPWLKQGLVREVAGKATFSAVGGGMFQLLLNMEQELLGPEGRCSVICHDSQLTQMWYNEQAKSWCLYSEFLKGAGRHSDWYSAHQVPNASTTFDTVIMGFDLDPRGARKASFKQMLESALPGTCPVIRCLASAPCASAMTCVVEFDSQKDLGLKETSLYGPDLKSDVVEVAERLDAASHSVGRGLRFGRSSEVWNITASVKWSKSVRSAFKGGWDKKKVESDLVEAFREVVPVSGRHKGLVPCFHWQGAWPLTALSDRKAKACVYDAANSLGYASDAFVFFGADEDASPVHRLRGCNLLHPFKSATDLADLVMQDLEGSPESRLPHRSEWSFRSDLLGLKKGGELAEYKDCGRADPQDGLDHTWPTAAELALNEALVIDEADSLKKYRKR